MRTDIKLLNSQLEAIADEETLQLDENTTLKFVEEGKWVVDGKYQSQEIIFTDGEKYYKGFIGRSGSYHSGYDYDSEDFDGLTTIREVKKKTKTIEYWENV